ncbi:DUF3006 domain-containing protein [Salinarchaeum sp. Harcht-Bsk1]|uniref:DUF3006 domain-containing protein n=1 Tax=Salinarchaeum sp. Harcht-Bsk1 TaxID=1333523 RepID=UPI001650F74E|nr:DUF3006 domain-containing protein [Salinarchaeum sp. Harcht-Bsk1]
MLRRDLLATLLALLPASAARSAFEGIQNLALEDDSDGEGDGRSRSDDSGDSRRDDAPGTAVVDRIEDDTAVVLFEDGRGQETVSTAVLPAAAREEGVVLRVPRGDSLALATVDRTATAARRRNASDRFDDLAKPGPESGMATNATGP